MQTNRAGLLELHLAVLLFGVAGLFGKWLTLTPECIVFARAAVAGVVLWLVGRRLREPSVADPHRGRARLGLIFAGVCLAFHWVTFFRAIQVSTVAVALFSFSSFPIFVTLLEPLVFRERLRAVDALTALLVCAGLACMTPSLNLGNAVTRGIGYGLLSGLSFAALALANRSLARTRSAMHVAAAQNLVAAMALVPFVTRQRCAPNGRDLLLLLLLGLVCTALSHSLFIHSLRTVRAQLASVTTGLEAVYGALLAAWFLGEVPSLRVAIGGVVILAATAFATWQRPPSRAHSI